VALREKLTIDIQRTPEYSWLLKVSECILQQPLKPKSFDNVIPGLNHLLTNAQTLAEEDMRRAELDSELPPDELVLAFSRTDFYLTASRKTDTEARRHSALGDSIRETSQKICRPRGIGNRNKKKQEDLQNLPMPLESFLEVLECAANSRDKALWTNIAAIGARPHEVLNMLWEDIHPYTGKPYIYDPKERRLGKNMTSEERIKFKGRIMSETQVIAPLRNALHRTLCEYHNDWFIPYADPNQPNFIFQYIDKVRRGEPFISVSNVALNASFQAACRRAQIPPPNGNLKLSWTIYSLRHLFGDYCINRIQTDETGKNFGMPLGDVQTAMGHADPRSTKVYARQNRERAAAAFEADDRARFPALGLDDGRAKK
jgi:integrase